jgi:hypothetical protein
MNATVRKAGEAGSDQPALRCAPLRLGWGIGRSHRVWSMQASGPVGRKRYRPTLQPNPALKRSAQRRGRWVPVVLRTPAPA